MTLHRHRAICNRTFALRVRLILLGMGGALWPRWAWAGCGVSDPGGCVDGAVYSFWEGIVQLLWGVNRAGLQLVYGVNQFRWWVVEVAFGFVYHILQGTLGPLLVPIATAALLIGVLMFVISPVVGRINVVDIRHALLWAVIAPTLLAFVGPHFVDIEQARADFASDIVSGGAERISSIPTFGARASDMGAPKPLYEGGNPCGVALTRRTKGLQADDLAAAMAAANTQDIFCPNAVGPGSALPDAFYDPSAPVYFATTSDVGNDLASSDRQAAIERIKHGMMQLLLMLFPVALAIMDALVQLVFALCLVAIWLTLPVALLVVYFQQTSHAVTGIFKQTIRIFQTSWTAAALLGIVLVCLRAAAKLTNATAYAGFAAFGLILTLYLLVVALQTLKSSLATVNDTVALATGINLGTGVEVARGVAGLAAGVATGGVGLAAGMAASGALAYKETGSGTYAAGAALGRIAPLVRVSEYTEAAGVIDDDLAAGMYAGYRSAQNMRMGRAVMHRDARQVDEDSGLTVRTRAEERSISTQLAARPLPIGTRVQRDGAGGLTTTTSAPPSEAITLPEREARIPRLLTLGYAVQRNADSTVTAWKAPDDASTLKTARQQSASNPAIAQALARLELVQRGAATGDVLQLRQALQQALDSARASGASTNGTERTRTNATTGTMSNGSAPATSTPLPASASPMVIHNRTPAPSPVVLYTQHGQPLPLSTPAPSVAAPAGVPNGSVAALVPVLTSLTAVLARLDPSAPPASTRASEQPASMPVPPTSTKGTRS